jgi:hypothetical protein
MFEQERCNLTALSSPQSMPKMKHLFYHRDCKIFRVLGNDPVKLPFTTTDISENLGPGQPALELTNCRPASGPVLAVEWGTEAAQLRMLQLAPVLRALAKAKQRQDWKETCALDRDRKPLKTP